MKLFKYEDYDHYVKAQRKSKDSVIYEAKKK